MARQSARTVASHDGWLFIVENVITPGRQVYVQPGREKIVAGPRVGYSGQLVLQGTGPAGDFVPIDMDHRLSSRAAEVSHDEVSLRIPLPTPRHQVLIAGIVRPAGTFAELPLTVTKHRVVEWPSGASCKRLRRSSIDRLFGPSAQEDRQSAPFDPRIVLREIALLPAEWRRPPRLRAPSPGRKPPPPEARHGSR